MLPSDLNGKPMSNNTKNKALVIWHGDDDTVHSAETVMIWVYPPTTGDCWELGISRMTETKPLSGGEAVKSIERFVHGT